MEFQDKRLQSQPTPLANLPTFIRQSSRRPFRRIIFYYFPFIVLFLIFFISLVALVHEIYRLSSEINISILPMVTKNQVSDTENSQAVTTQGIYATSEYITTQGIYATTEYIEYHNTSNSNTTVLMLPEPCEGSMCAFYPRLSLSETDLLRDILMTFVSAADKANITYFLAYGTLLGAYRHGGLIPWDDDLDVMISLSDADAMLKMLKKLAPEYGSTRYSKRLKLFSPLGKAVTEIHRRHGFTFPNLDIFLYDNSSEKLWDNAYLGYGAHLTTVFPLETMPFWGQTMKVPRDTFLYFQELNYDINICQSNSYDHRNERVLQHPVTVNCTTLHTLYPNILHFGVYKIRH